jgi:Tfp pilus assembly protein PilZ
MPLIIVLVSALPIGFGLLRVKRAAYVSALVQAAALLAVGIATASFTDEVGVLVFAPIAQSGVLVAVFLAPNVRSPFMQQRKGFRRFKRHEANLKVALEVNGKDGPRACTGNTFDISLGGTYVITDPVGFSTDTRVKISIELREGKHLRLPARIVAVSPEGVGGKPAGLGIEFTSLSSYDKETLKAFVGIGRHHERIPVTLPITFERGSAGSTHAETYDLSMSGCYVKGADLRCSPGDRLSLTLMLNDDDPMELMGEVMWLSLTEQKGKPPGVAIQFLELSRGEKRRLKERLKQAGVT